jgi:hypothetical protein
MNAPAENVITSPEMLQKIGLLTMSNEFLSTQIAGYSQYITTLRKNLTDEIAAIEAEIAKTEGEAKIWAEADVKAFVARIKAKLG